MGAVAGDLKPPCKAFYTTEAAKSAMREAFQNSHAFERSCGYNLRMRQRRINVLDEKVEENITHQLKVFLLDSTECKTDVASPI